LSTALLLIDILTQADRLLAYDEWYKALVDCVDLVADNQLNWEDCFSFPVA
jgi:hypothetical protein